MRHGNATQLYGAEHGHRRQDTGPTDRGLDRLDNRDLLLCLKLVRNCPPRRTRSCPQPGACCPVVDFINNTVDFKRQIRANGSDLIEKSEATIAPPNTLQQPCYAESPFAKSFGDLEIARRYATTLDRTQTPGVKTERARRGDAWIKLAQAPCRGITRIGELLLSQPAERELAD